MMKKCYKCNIEKTLDNFGKLSNSKDGYRYDCKLCRKKYRVQNKLYISTKQKEYYLLNKSTLLEKNKNYRINNAETILKQRQQYRNNEEIKKHIKQKNKEYLPIRSVKIKERRKNDNTFKISEILRSKFKREVKKNKYSEFLGCDILFFKKWIEYQFSNDMNWDNIGDIWHIDHVLPINAFDLSNINDIQCCYHWTNLQPLKKKENISKSDKILLHHYFNTFITVFRFNKYNKQFIGYQAVNKSLQWLRIKYSSMVKMPHMKVQNEPEIDNPQPSH